MSMTKREFLKGGAATAAGVTLAGLIGQGDAEAAAGRKESNSALKSMLRRIRDLKAERAIRFKLASYARALDRLDTELAATLFAPDSYVDYGTNPITGQVIYKGSGAGLMKWLHEVDSSIYNLGGQFQHVACQSFILINGKVAASETYGYAWLALPASAGQSSPRGVLGVVPGQVQLSFARYLDRWECRDGDWLIVRRVVTSDGGFAVAPGGPLYPRYNFATDKTDPSYEILDISDERHNRS